MSMIIERIQGQCEDGHPVEITLDANGTIAGTLGTIAIPELPPEDRTISVACQACTRKVHEQLAGSGWLR